MTAEQRLLEIFFEIHRGLPRQGPGSDESTRKAFALCAELPKQPAIVDIGCGPGMQTLALAKATDGKIVAVDTTREYLDELRARAAAECVADRIEIREADMNSLPFTPGSFDLIWSEGAAYNMGFANALKAWAPLLKPGDYLAVSELVWLTPDPPAEAAAFFGAGYPAMQSVEANLALFRASGYDMIGHFTLPDRDWWQHYYTPLEAKLPPLFEKYGDDGDAFRIVETTKREIEIRRRFPDAYGYEFFVARRPGQNRHSGARAKAREPGIQ